MPRYAFTVDIVEHGREGVVEAPSKAEARRMIREGEWDAEQGLDDPKRYTTRVIGKVTEIKDDDNA